GIVGTKNGDEQEDDPNKQRGGGTEIAGARPEEVGHERDQQEQHDCRPGAAENSAEQLVGGFHPYRRRAHGKQLRVAEAISEGSEAKTIGAPEDEKGDGA